MIKTYYEVHSDLNSELVFASYEGRGAKQKAICYAKSVICQKSWVEKVTYNSTREEYEYCGTVWSYDWKE